MIASCWDWPSLKYSYFIIENQPLDAGGWSPTKGIVAGEKSLGSNVSLSLEDCLPSLPENSYFAGVGDFCVGELYEKRDENTRPKIDLERMFSEGTPQDVKVVELLKGERKVSIRGNPSKNNTHSEEVYRIEDKSVFQTLVPTITALGSGFLFFRTFQRYTESNLGLRDVLLSWAAGIAVGVTVGQEAAKHDLLGTSTRKKGHR